KAVAPLDLAEERLAVVSVAYGARCHGQHALGAESLGLAPVRDQAVADARNRRGKQAAAPVDTLAEARDPLAPLDRLEPLAVDVGDEEARRVRAQVDRCDAGHLLGMNDRAESTSERTSPAAPMSTRVRASELFRLSRRSCRSVTCFSRAVTRSCASAAFRVI